MCFSCQWIMNMAILNACLTVVVNETILGYIFILKLH